MTSAQTVVRARLMLGANGVADVVRWRSSGVARPGSGARPASSGDLIAAERMADHGALEIADVIYRRTPASTPPSAWLPETLDRYPGCFAAAIPTAGCRYLIALRASRPFIFSIFMPNEHRFNVLIGAIFVHGWLCAGWPLAGLDPPRLDAAGTFRPAARTTIVPVSFRLCYEGPPPSSASSGGPSSPSRVRIR